MASYSWALPPRLWLRPEQVSKLLLIKDIKVGEIMNNRLEVVVDLTYGGSREYVTKKGEKVLLHKFLDSKGNYIENTLALPFKAEVGTKCSCILECGQRWIDAEKRFNVYFRVTSASAKNK